MKNRKKIKTIKIDTTFDNKTWDYEKVIDGVTGTADQDGKLEMLRQKVNEIIEKINEK